MENKIYSTLVAYTIEKAKNICKDSRHHECTTAHILAATLSITRAISENENNDKNFEKYKDFYDRIKVILNNHGLTGELFKKAITTKFLPIPITSDNNPVCSIELTKVFEKLEKQATLNKRQITLTDLIREIFSDAYYEVYSVIELATGSAQETDKICDDMLKEFKAEIHFLVKDLENIPALMNLNRYVKEKKFKFVGTEKTDQQIKLALSCRTVNSAVLVGAAGTGKTFAVYSFVNAINSQTAGDFNDRIVYQLDPASLVSGSRFRGDFEEKLLNIIEVVKKNPKVLLFIDEIHSMIGAGDGGSQGGAMDGSNILKPYISRGEIQLLGATTSEEWSKFVEPDKAFTRRFNKVNVSEPTLDETKEILLGVNEVNESFFKRRASEGLVDIIVNLSKKYSLELANPAKSLGMMELAFAYSKVFNEKGEVVMDDDAFDAIKKKYDIKISKTRSADTKKGLSDVLLGQDNILTTINDNLSYIEAGLVDIEKPLLSMIFAGPTGVGKTEAAKIIAKEFCGSEKALIKLNMGEYGSEMDVSKLVGAAPGYISSDTETTLVTQIKQYPCAVLLLDEIEKANKLVLDVFLNILDTGEMMDNHKNNISFRNCIIIFTTNLGFSHGFSKGTGLGFVNKKTTNVDVIETIKSYFKPEFINRIDDIISFNGLTNDVADRLINRYKDAYSNESGMCFNLLDADYEEIRKEADIEEYGARGLKRAVRKQLLKIDKRQKAEIHEKVEEKELVPQN